jgi:apolipoprotein D and lipocalin family protein
MTLRSSLILALAAAFLSVDAMAAKAPEPLKPVDAAVFYKGRWLEIGRKPMWLTDGCVAGSTTYTPRPDGKIDVLDACNKGGVNGKEAALKGVGTIEDPGTNAKLRVRYNVLIKWDYWVLDHADDYSWFISADPDFDKLWIYTRKVPTPEQRDLLVARAKALGYDTSKLEFPAQPPAE